MTNTHDICAEIFDFMQILLLDSHTISKPATAHFINIECVYIWKNVCENDRTVDVGKRKMKKTAT